jgi:hypothetical protein
MLVSCPRNSRYFVAIKMGRRQGGPSRTGTKGAYLNRYVTDEQRSRRPIFIATLRAGASWVFFRVARSTRMTQIWALRSRLEKQPTDLRQSTCYFGDRTLPPAIPFCSTVLFFREACCLFHDQIREDRGVHVLAKCAGELHLKLCRHFKTLNTPLEQ